MFRTILRAGTAADLAVARSILDAAAIAYVVRNEHANLVPLVGSTELAVDVDDEDTATALLRHAGLID